MKKSEIYTHKNKSSSSGYSHDGSYKIVDHIRSKDRVTGEWYDSILYQDIKSGDMYSREKKDFMYKFQKSEYIDPYPTKIYALACVGGCGSDWEHIGFSKSLNGVKTMLAEIMLKSKKSNRLRDYAMRWNISNKEKIELGDEVYQWFEIKCKPSDVIYFSFYWHDEAGLDYISYRVNWKIDDYIEFSKMKIWGDPTVKLRDLNSFQDIDKIHGVLEFVDLDGGYRSYIRAQKIKPPKFTDDDYESEFI